MPNKVSTWLSNAVNGYAKDADGNLIAPGTNIAINDKGQLVDTTKDGSAFENLTQEQLDSVAKLAQDQMTSRYEDNMAEREQLQTQYDTARENLNKAALNGSVSVDELDRLEGNVQKLEDKLADNLSQDQTILSQHATVTNAIDNMAMDHNLENTYEDTNNALKFSKTEAYASEQLNHAADGDGKQLNLQKAQATLDDLNSERTISRKGLESVQELLNQERKLDGSVLTEEDKKNNVAGTEARNLNENARILYTNPENNETSEYTIKELENLEKAYERHLETTKDDVIETRNDLNRIQNASVKDPNRVVEPTADKTKHTEEVEAHNKKTQDTFDKEKSDQDLRLAQTRVDDYTKLRDDIRGDRKDLHDKKEDIDKAFEKYEKEQDKIEKYFKNENPSSDYISTKNVDADKERSLSNLDSKFTVNIDGKDYNLHELESLQKNTDAAIEKNKERDIAISNKLTDAEKNLTEVQGKAGKDNPDANKDADKDANKDSEKSGKDSAENGTDTAKDANEALKNFDTEKFNNATDAEKQEMANDLINEIGHDEFNKLIEDSANGKLDEKTQNALDGLGEKTDASATQNTDKSDDKSKSDTNLKSKAKTDEDKSNDKSDKTVKDDSSKSTAAQEAKDKDEDKSKDEEPKSKVNYGPAGGLAKAATEAASKAEAKEPASETTTTEDSQKAATKQAQEAQKAAEETSKTSGNRDVQIEA